MKKKMVAVLMVSALICSMAAGCGSSSEKERKVQIIQKHRIMRQYILHPGMSQVRMMR